MSRDRELEKKLEQGHRRSADNDPMLQAYARLWLPYAERAVAALESQAKSQANIVRILAEIRDYR
ncbi:hypothetical protein SAMN05216386_1658 [Nitrosospira briensis]|uniref:Uncharacterized protein n=1 Tax=Nitrosospira briensis TaxID=35799 RepID=A0A1I5B4K7_9PROT|nr:hypothetical protein [Nitrosospira briensis]SFN69540.1 hypothetical protein SAMN05216386_1658 [Nitrosospira briensis]